LSVFQGKEGIRKFADGTEIFTISFAATDLVCLISPNEFGNLRALSSPE
jgi:hypothetical protein